MNIIQRIRRKYNYLMDNEYIKRQQKRLIEEIKSSYGCKTIFYFCVPRHSNLGDQAQYMCWLRLFGEFYHEYRIVCLPCQITTIEALQLIKDQIGKDDRIYVHSGYLIFDPHPELPFICNVVNLFCENPITILPQTINLMSEAKKKMVTNSFNAHPNLTVISRDEVSFQNACDLFPEYKGFQYDNVQRSGIMFCIRNDREKYYSDIQIEELKRKFGKIRVDMNDTSITMPIRYWNERRELLIQQSISSFATYQLIITDRYHGTIFSQIANTPVIVLSSSDHKLSSGVKWFPKEVFGKNIFYANDLKEAYFLATTILERKGVIYKNPPYFREKFYSQKF